uniref:Putative wd repeat-containing protein 75 n=1 Tax=Ixodes ricinus TaxID=34613 RepID=A0A131XUS3_IXORI
MTFKEQRLPRCKAGASLIKYKPVFSYDSKFFLVPSGRSVKVFSCSSGECVRTFGKHAAEVVAVVRNPENHVQVLSCSEDGVVIKWDPSDGSVLKKYEVTAPASGGGNRDVLAGFYAPPSGSAWFCLRGTPGAGWCRLETCPAGGDEESRVLVDKVSLGGASPVAFGGPSCGLYAAIHKARLFVGDCTALAFSLKKFWSKGKQHGVHFTCVTCHPTARTLATGDSLGCITIWQGLEEGAPARSVYHWHTLPVADLVFSSTGGFLLSGGGECVLVKWGLASGDKQFLPRMGMPLCRLTASPDSAHILTAHEDNCLQLLSSQLRVERVVQGLARSPCRAKPCPFLLHDPRWDSLVLGGRPGHLQFYQLQHDKQLFSLDVVGLNYVTQERDGAVVNTEVALASLAGDWLASVQHWADADLGPETRLKFWRFDHALQNFVLDTSVYQPHGVEVVDLQLRHPASPGQAPLAVTAGRDRRFRLWAPEHLEEDRAADSPDTSRGGAPSRSWNCVASGRYRDLQPGRCAFSEDGSLLAVAFGRSATLWSEECRLVGSLAHPHCPSQLGSLAFGRGSSCCLLLSCTETRLIAWDVVSLSVLWELEKAVTCLVTDPSSEFVAAFCEDAKLLVFEPQRRGAMVECDVPPSCQPVVSAIFVPEAKSPVAAGGHQRPLSRLCFVSVAQELFTWDEENNEEEGEDATVRLEELVPATPFGALVAQQTKTAVQAAAGAAGQLHSRVGTVGFKEVHQLLEVASHTLPSMTSLYQNFLSAFLSKTDTPGSPRAESDEDEDMTNQDAGSDSDMEVDHEPSQKLPQEEAPAEAPVARATTKKVKLAKAKHFAWLSEMTKS